MNEAQLKEQLEYYSCQEIEVAARLQVIAEADREPHWNEIECLRSQRANDPAEPFRKKGLGNWPVGNSVKCCFCPDRNELVGGEIEPQSVYSMDGPHRTDRTCRQVSVRASASCKVV